MILILSACLVVVFQYFTTKFIKTYHPLWDLLLKSSICRQSYMKQQSSLQKDIPILEEQLKAIVPDENKIAEIQKKINGHQSKLDEVSLKAQKKDDMIKKCDKDLKDLNNK